MRKYIILLLLCGFIGNAQYNLFARQNFAKKTSISTLWDGLVSLYKLDEITGTLANDSYGAAHLTNTGITINQTGKLGTSYASTSAGQNLNATGVAAITGNFTMNVWCYRMGNTTVDNISIFEQGDYGAGFGIWLKSNNYVGWFINTNYNNYILSNPLPLNDWVMITITYDGTYVKLYQNGALMNAWAFSTNPLSATTRRMFNRTSNTDAYIGRLDNASVFNRALTLSEIASHYNGGSGITL